ncbi:hypothetical protein GCM10023156_11110 [Novipirellula rosea]|uniref:Uncharacterized protein n=1 Tax=Novipirellula rosea TaxID=1031540 RepID=A0ABP8MEP6_9BACT
MAIATRIAIRPRVLMAVRPDREFGWMTLRARICGNLLAILDDATGFTPKVAPNGNLPTFCKWVHV